MKSENTWRALHLRKNHEQTQNAIRYEPEALALGIIGRLANEVRGLDDSVAVRIHAYGDVLVPQEIPIIQRVCAAFPQRRFPLISKSLTFALAEAEALLKSPNLYLTLSYSWQTKSLMQSAWEQLKRSKYRRFKGGRKRLLFAYTLSIGEAESVIPDFIDTIFVVDRKVAQKHAREKRYCPCDTKELPLDGACSTCNQCSGKMWK